jgi:hypothetical protein
MYTTGFQFLFQQRFQKRGLASIRGDINPSRILTSYLRDTKLLFMIDCCIPNSYQKYRLTY